MEKSEGRKSVSQARVENGMENPGLELMVIQYGGCCVALVAFSVSRSPERTAWLISYLPVLVGRWKSCAKKHTRGSDTGTQPGGWLGSFLSLEVRVLWIPA
jgi:hypothetical protein